MLKMNRNYIYISLLSIFITWCYFCLFSTDTDLINRNKELIECRQELEYEIIRLSSANDSLKAIERVIINNYYSSIKKIQENEQEIKSVNDYVYSLNELSIDSTIRQYTHKSYDSK